MQIYGVFVKFAMDFPKYTLGAGNCTGHPLRGMCRGSWNRVIFS